MYSGYSAGPTRINATGQTNWSISQVSATNIGTYIIDIVNPQVASQTTGFINSISTSTGDFVTVAIQHGLSNSYDSLTLGTTGGTMTGAVEAYGFNV